jgi:hypothetical protein
MDCDLPVGIQGRWDGQRVSIINFKGGVGKTTLAFHLGTGLALDNSRVLLIDMDHQSSLSILCLRPGQWVTVVNAGRVVDEIFRHMVNPQHTFPDEEIIAREPLNKNGGGFSGSYRGSFAEIPRLSGPVSRMFRPPSWLRRGCCGL